MSTFTVSDHKGDSCPRCGAAFDYEYPDSPKVVFKCGTSIYLGSDSLLRGIQCKKTTAHREEAMRQMQLENQRYENQSENSFGMILTTMFVMGLIFIVGIAGIIRLFMDK